MEIGPAPQSAFSSSQRFAVKTFREQIIFSFVLIKKTVSVCASNDSSASSGYLQYRFGQKGALELAFPDLTESAPASQSVQARTLMFSGGGGGYLRFINGLHHYYIVYAVIGKGWGAKDGVAVEKNNRLIANLECQNILVSKLNEAFFTHAGLSAASNTFFSSLLRKIRCLCDRSAAYFLNIRFA